MEDEDFCGILIWVCRCECSLKFDFFWKCLVGILVCFLRSNILYPKF